MHRCQTVPKATPKTATLGTGSNYNQEALVDYWEPVKPEFKGWHDWSVIGRLKEDVTLSQGRAQLRLLAQVQAREDPGLEGITADAEPLISELNREGKKVLFPITGAVAVVFLIACANVSGLLLVRGLRRQSEFAVRGALGASRLAIIRQMLWESVPLGLLGGLLGIGLAMVLVRVMKAVGTDAIPRVDAVAVNWPVLLFCFTTSLIAAAVASVLPALRACHAAPVDVLKSSGLATGSSRAERRLLGIVAGLQIALTVGLLFGAGLLVRTVSHLLAVQSGFDVSNLLTLSVTEPTPTKWLDFHTRAMEKVAAVPGVQHAAFAWGVPLTGNHWTTSYEVVGEPAFKSPGERPSIPTRAVTPDYFATMGMTLLEGRTFREDERWDSNNTITNVPWVVIVNQAFADKHVGKGIVIGRRLKFDNNPDHPAEIIGVVANTRTGGLDQQPSPEIYFSFWQQGPFTKHLVVRTIADPKLMIGAITAALREVDPTVAIENIKTMAQVRDDSIAPRVFISRLLVGLAMAASLLAGVGTYGVIAYSVGSRSREIAIRVAIGATRRDVLAIVAREVIRLAGAGLAAGIMVAVVLTHLLQVFIYGVGTFDPLTWVAVPVITVAIAAIASVAPARRAIATEPMIVLRGE